MIFCLSNNKISRIHPRVSASKTHSFNQDQCCWNLWLGLHHSLTQFEDRLLGSWAQCPHSYRVPSLHLLRMSHVALVQIYHLWQKTKKVFIGPLSHPCKILTELLANLKKASLCHGSSFFIEMSPLSSMFWVSFPELSQAFCFRVQGGWCEVRVVQSRDLSWEPKYTTCSQLCDLRKLLIFSNFNFFICKLRIICTVLFRGHWKDYYDNSYKALSVVWVHKVHSPTGRGVAV